MLIISHRGYTNGPDDFLENNPEHIKELLTDNLSVEIDVWFVDGALQLGHDNPKYIISDEFIKNELLWCHAKNLEAMHHMLNIGVKNFFWHQEDDFTLTSSGFIWTYPNRPISDKSIIVDLSKNWFEREYNCFGVCVDYLI
jgi:hypothetical protein